MRRGLFVDYLDIVGPFNPSTAPPESYTKIFICSQKTPQCARTILSSLMERAYRRPVTRGGAEVEARSRRARAARRRFVRRGHPPGAAGDSGVAEFPVPHRSESDRGRGREIAIGRRRANVLARMSDAPRPALPSTRDVDEYPVSDIELASRLSYFLWASMPDAELMRVAKAGTLRQPAVLEAQVRRMMADPKGYNLVENWAAQWLQLRNLGRTKPDPKRFPDGGRRAARRHAQRDDDVRRDHHQGR